MDKKSWQRKGLFSADRESLLHVRTQAVSLENTDFRRGEQRFLVADVPQLLHTLLTLQRHDINLHQVWSHK